ncbi:predicted protein, partial [Histoplasma capsulatum G186AR]
TVEQVYETLLTREQSSAEQEIKKLDRSAELKMLTDQLLKISEVNKLSTLDNSLNSIKAKDKIDEEMNAEEEADKHLNTVELYTLIYKEYLRWKREVAVKVLLNMSASMKNLNE